MAILKIPKYLNWILCTEHVKTMSMQFASGLRMLFFCVVTHAGAPLRILGPLDSIFTRALLRGGWGGGDLESFECRCWAEGGY